MKLPGWWCYPTACEFGHPWGPGRILVGWLPCDCPGAMAAWRAGNHARGHRTVSCQRPGCRSVWYKPVHED